jgi:hypothetical protein
MERLLTIGLQEGKLKHISDVVNGLLCKCVCANCKYPLVAKNNPSNKKAAHFAHHSGNECVGAYETALHLLAKHVFQKYKQIRLPDFHFDYDNRNVKSRFKYGIRTKFDEVIIEQEIASPSASIIPDAIGKNGGRYLLVEFANTHFVDAEKLKIIKELGIACIEIDLSNTPMDEAAMLDLFTSDSLSKYWISNPRRDEDYQKHLELEKIKAGQKLQTERERYSQLKADKSIRVIKIYKDSVNYCPKKDVELLPFKESNFYRHHILKKIIDGTAWNGKFYGNHPNGSWIFLKNEKIIVYPSKELLPKYTAEQIKEAKFFWAGLKEISRVIINDEFGDCANCIYSKEQISVGETFYQVCSHPTIS